MNWISPQKNAFCWCCCCKDWEGIEAENLSHMGRGMGCQCNARLPSWFSIKGFYFFMSQSGWIWQVKYRTHRGKRGCTLKNGSTGGNVHLINLHGLVLNSWHWIYTLYSYSNIWCHFHLYEINKPEMQPHNNNNAMLLLCNDEREELPVQLLSNQDSSYCQTWFLCGKKHVDN